MTRHYYIILKNTSTFNLLIYIFHSSTDILYYDIGLSCVSRLLYFRKSIVRKAVDRKSFEGVLGNSIRNYKQKYFEIVQKKMQSREHTLIQIISNHSIRNFLLLQTSKILPLNNISLIHKPQSSTVGFDYLSVALKLAYR